MSLRQAGLVWLAFASVPIDCTRCDAMLLEHRVVKC